MRIATWNVNSVKQRIENLTAWLGRARARHRLPAGDQVPWTRRSRARPIEALGYNVAVHGQKTFNGVAILSKFTFDEVTPRLPGDDADDHARFIEADGLDQARRACGWRRSICPTATRPDTEKYPYKIKWMERLAHYAHERLELEEPLVLAGDYNVIPAAGRRAQSGRLDAPTRCSCRRPGRSSARLTNLGLTDAMRAVSDAAGPLHLLGLPGRRLAEELGHPHRPPAAVAAGRRPAAPPPASTSTCAPGRSRPTTCRSRSIWILRRPD